MNKNPVEYVTLFITTKFNISKQAKNNQKYNK